MKKILSLSTLWQSTKDVILRFPLPFIIILFTIVVWWIAIEIDHSNRVFPFYTLLAIAYVTFSFTLACDLFVEQNKISTLIAWIIRLAIVGFSLILYVSLSPEWIETDVYRLVLLIIAGHLMVSFAPHYPMAQVNAFWQYNKILFLRFLTAVLYSAVLYLGIVIALLSIDTLFDQNISGDIYFKLFVLIAVGFNTIFFLAGIPKELQLVDQQTDYPKGLKIFTQYVLIPLLTLYLTILLVYEIKILLDKELPDGTVSVLILGYAVFGILSVLLIYPLKYNSGNEWIKVFSRFFFLFMIPLLILMFFAIWARISSYALTEPRFFLIIIAVWLAILVIYFITVKTPNIQLIPITLCFLALLFTFGPQSAAAIAKKSQLSRFQELRDPKNKLSAYKLKKEKAAIITYLVRTHGLTSLQPFTKVNLENIQKTLKEKIKTSDRQQYSIKEELLDTAFALLNVNPVLNTRYYGAVTFEIAEEITTIRGYEYSMNIQSYDAFKEGNSPLGKVVISNFLDKNRIKVKIGEKDSVLLDLTALSKTQTALLNNDQVEAIQNSRNTYQLPQNKLSLMASTPNFQLSFVFKNMTLLRVDSLKNKAYSHYNGILLIKNRSFSD